VIEVYGRFIQRTLSLIKPDGVQRALVGRIISIFEDAGLRLSAMKMLQATRKQLCQHFPVKNNDWISGMGAKSIEVYQMHGMDPAEEFGTDDPLEIGKIILQWNFEYLLSGPLVAMVLEGPWAISVVRKLVGDTIPAKALPGTIRGTFSINSADHANSVHSACYNIVHASGNPEEAKKECEVWFNQEELVSYERADERVMFSRM
jgi:nucleoside-diphosphate kinase